MKINERNGVLDTQLGGAEALRSDAGTTTRQGTATASGDRVSVSDTARSLAALRADVGDLGAVREDRVAGLRAVLDDGSYQVDFHTVAASVLREIGADALA